MSDTPPNAPQNGEAPQVRLLTQYLKDLSFESPASPQSLRAEQGPPGIDVGVDVNARRVAGDQFEVELSCSATAMRNDDQVFVVEVSYGGLFQLQNLPDEQIEAFLLVEAPRLLFPFARQIIAQATRDGGFTPLLLEPIDFTVMYQMQRQRAQQAENGGQAGTA